MQALHRAEYVKHKQLVFPRLIVHGLTQRPAHCATRQSTIVCASGSKCASTGALTKACLSVLKASIHRAVHPQGTSFRNSSYRGSAIALKFDIKLLIEPHATDK